MSLPKFLSEIAGLVWLQIRTTQHNDYLNIDREIRDADKGMLVTIYDMAGRKINSQLLTANDRTVKITGASGMYIIECTWGINKRKVFRVLWESQGTRRVKLSFS